MTEICSVILAAGSSRRLGFSKLLVKIDSEAVIRRTVEPFTKHISGETFVVTGERTLSLARELQGLHVTVVQNKDHERGMSTSIKAALPFISQAKAAFFHLGDKPFVKEELLSAMLAIYEKNDKDIVIPVCGGLKGHPVLMSIAPYLEDMSALEGDRGLRDIIEKHPENVVFIEADDDILFDIDTPQDIETLQKRGYTIEKSQG
jgi:molybdenum cofactor cytidylyltransferase